MKTFKMALLAGTAVVALSTAATDASATLVKSYQFNGNGNWSIDAVGSNNTPVGDLTINVPVGSTIEKAFLYSSMFVPSLVPTVDFDGTVLAAGDFVALGVNNGLAAYRADVTAQVALKVGGGGGAFVFPVNSEDPNSNIDGEVLAVVYSNPGEAERTIAFLDGFSSSGGDAFNVALAAPWDDSIANAEALLSLGIGFGFQGFDQASNVDVNGRRLTSSAGGQDDGIDENGGLITVGGEGDDPANPSDPLAGPNADPRFDDELYNLVLGNGADPAAFLLNGVTNIRIDTENPSGDDNIFFAGFNITAVADITPDGVPEPATMVLFGLGLIGLSISARRRIAA